MPDLNRMRAAAAELEDIVQRQRTSRRAGAAGRAAAASAYAVRIEHRMSDVTATSATVWLHGIVGDDWDGLDSGTFARELAALDVESLTVRINSPGGFVSHGVAMYGALVEHPARKVVRVDGLAASAASMIAMAGTEIEISKPARMMIHDAWGIAIGNAAELLKEAEILDGISEDMAAVYAGRAGGKAKDWRARMLAETWYSSADSVASGLADRVVNDPAKTSTPEDRASQLIRARARANLILKG